MSNELSKRAVACKGWRWMPGMKALTYGDDGVVSSVWTDGYTIDGTPSGPPVAVWVQWDEECRASDVMAAGAGECLPDLTDPATLGCLMALVCGVVGDDYAHLKPLKTNVCCDGPGSDLVPAVWWCVADGDGRPYMHGTAYLAGPSKAEALVAALEAAEGQEL